MRTNEQLLELYNKKMPLLKKSLDEYNENTKDKATNPLLIKVSEKWEDSEVKIMIIGSTGNISFHVRVIRTHIPEYNPESGIPSCRAVLKPVKISSFANILN